MDTTKFRGYWNLDEASGDATDSTVNALTLTETSGTIGTSEGGRQFVSADTEYLGRAGDDALLSFGDEEMTFGCWVKLASQTSVQTLISKYDANDQRAYQLIYNNTADRYFVQFDDNGLGPTTGTANTYGAVPDATWNFVVGYHDPATNTIGIGVNGGAFDTIAHTGGIFNNTAKFTLGASWDNVTVQAYLNGILKSAFVYAGLFTTADLALIYNSGIPLKWNGLLERITAGNTQVLII